MSSSASERNPPVLVVEDEALVRMVMVDELEEAGFRVIEADNADDGLAELERHQDIMALLTDIELPGSIDGVKLARITNERYPDAAVIVMSGRIRPGRQELPRHARFFGKPYRHAEVIEALHELMGRT
ncbi:response regulator [Antarcticirhabdus aurantiaca]|uniref:Response regulator n=1 Tax=Antarcticirhabdus aurantiaca TaxID=2606717 RepID=A0ACD4NRE0_9HYPH|nr:response regulator [Antarcticirhabdus aurantiaca]WAJ29519.1 response regulator [Jeongeuplla avenae]